MIIFQNSPSIIVMNLYLLSIQKAPFIIGKMLTRYKCLKNVTLKPNNYRGWNVQCVLQTIGLGAPRGRGGWLIESSIYIKFHDHKVHVKIM